MATAFTVVFLLSAKIGLIDAAQMSGPRRPHFDRQECLNRKLEELFPGMFIEDLSDSARSEIAHACAHEQYGQVNLTTHGQTNRKS
jgi:hypothetical protein